MSERSSLTYEALLLLLAAGDDAGVVEILRGRTEEERRPVGQQLVEAIRSPWGFSVPVDPETAMSAAVGTATFTALKRLRHQHQWGLYATEATETIIVDRNPPWLEQWVEHCLDQQAKASGRAFTAFSFCRCLVRAGHCPRRTSDAYILCMYTGIAVRPYRRRSRWVRPRVLGQPKPAPDPEEEAFVARWPGRNIRTVLLAEPDLLDWEIWQLFTVPGRPRRMLTPPPKSHQGRKSNMLWDSVLADLSAEGYLDRSRLLDETLAGAARPFPPNQVAWYIMVHDRLDPTPDERAARVDAYLHLLGAPAAPAVKFAVEQLTQLEKLGRLDPEAFFSDVEPVLYTAPRVTAMAALRIAKALLKRDPASSVVGLRTVVEALAHTHPDVQAAALTIIELADPDADVIDAVSAHAASADRSLQERLRVLVEVGQPARR